MGWFEEEIAGGADFLFAVAIFVRNDFGQLEVNEDGAAGDVDLESFAVKGESIAVQSHLLFGQFKVLLFGEPVAEILKSLQIGRGGGDLVSDVAGGFFGGGEQGGSRAGRGG